MLNFIFWGALKWESYTTIELKTFLFELEREWENLKWEVNGWVRKGNRSNWKSNFSVNNSLNLIDRYLSLVVDAMEIPFNYSEISLTTILKLSSLHSHIISIIIIIVVVVVNWIEINFPFSFSFISFIFRCSSKYKFNFCREWRLRKLHDRDSWRTRGKQIKFNSWKFNKTKTSRKFAFKLY